MAQNGTGHQLQPLQLPKSYQQPHRGDQQNKDALAIGDIYERLPKSKFPRKILPRAQGPYIEYIRKLAKGWPHLQYLADFMDVTTAPVKNTWLWDDPQDRQERASRTKVAVLDFGPGDTVKRTDCTAIAKLSEILNLPQRSSNDVNGRLYVVEDLSSDVIEVLGARFDIDPLFFRSQISDYMWNNTRDPWVELPSLNAVSRKRSFFCIRYFQPRYFRDEASFVETADQETGAFNVLRRIDNNHAWKGTKIFDVEGSDVGMVRSKMSLWIRKNKPNETGVLGILVVDPTIEAGFPLWGGYETFQECPSMQEVIGRNADIKAPPRTSLFEEVVYYSSSLTADEIKALPEDPRLLIKNPLLIVCAEWTTLVKYLTTRLTQLEWELDHNEETPFRNPDGLEKSLDSLNMWRRRIPVYQEWVSETLSHVITPDNFIGFTKNSILDLREDFKHLQDALKAVVERADRIQGSVSAIISITENKKAIQLNRTATRLTYLAVVFVPLTWVSGFFSMQVDVTLLRETAWVYFACAIPITVLALIVLRYYTRVERRVELWRQKRKEDKKKVLKKKNQNGGIPPTSNGRRKPHPV
ncbi:hypothetical protein MMC30_002495 [Trapelia coarctata]|nr:hypothetical protein [Trapelia coarctata]